MTQLNPLSPEEKGMSSQDETIRRAVLVIQSLVGSTFLFGALGTYLAITTGAWQSIAFAAWIVLAEGILFFSTTYIRRGKMNLGGWIILGANTFGTVFAAMLYVSLGYVAAAYLLVTNFFLIRYVISRDTQRPAIFVASIGLIFSIAAEIINPAWRQTAQLFLTLSPIITALLGIAFLVVVGYQAWVQSMRNKLLVAFISVTVVAAGALAVYVFTSTNNILQQGLERELSAHTDEIALRVGDLFNEQINTLTTLSLNEVLQAAVERENRTYSGGAAAIQAVLDKKDAQWQTADAIDNNGDPLVREHLTNDVARELIEYQKAFPENVEVFITDVYGGLAGTTNRTSDYYQADEGWWQAAYNDGEGTVYISEPEYDESADALAVLIALPLRNRETGEIIGILRTTFLTSAIGKILEEPVGETGETDLFIPGEVVSHFHEGQYAPIEPGEFEALQAIADQGMVEMDYEGVPSVVVRATMKTLEGNPAVDNLGWAIVFHQHQDEAFGPVNAQIRGTLIVMAIVLILAVAAAFGLAIMLVRPITQLTKTAEEVAAGNLSSRAEVATTDEIGTLASTFNSMTAQLQETLEGLEGRVAARTRDLAIVAEVGTATATVLESQKLLQEVVDLTKERFNLYHSHIYLLDENGENLVLAAGAGEPGRIMVMEGRSIPLDREQSLVARAARERQGVTVNDVTQAPDHLPNPLLPDTRSELAVPMIVGGNVIGVFDIQSNQVGRFAESDINIQTTLAAQLAVSIQNVRSFERSKKDADLQSLVNVIGRRIQRATSIEDTLQTAIRELGTAIGASRVKASLKPAADDGTTEAILPPEPLVTEVEVGEQASQLDEAL